MEKTSIAQKILSNPVIYCMALDLASQKGHHDIIKYLSEMPIVAPDDDDISEIKQIYLAAQTGNFNFFKNAFKDMSPRANQNGNVFAYDHAEIVSDQNEPQHDVGEGTSQHNVTHQSEDEIVLNNFFIAAEIGEMSKIKSFVDQRIDVNSRNENGFTALHIAARAGQVECVQFLLKHVKNINCQTTPKGSITYMDKTALHLACEYNHLAVVLALVNMDANINAKDYKGRVPLYYAAKSESIGIVRILLNNGANSNAIDSNGCSILSEAHNKDILNIFFERHFDYEKKTPHGSLLHSAAEYDNAVLANFIFQNKLNVNINQKNSRSYTAIFVAAMCNSCNVMKILLQYGANVDDTDNYGRDPLHIAILYNRYYAVELLLKQVPNVNELLCKTPLITLAVKQNNVEMTLLLLKHEADVQIKDNEGRTALDHAESRNYSEIVHILKPFYCQPFVSNNVIGVNNKN